MSDGSRSRIDAFMESLATIDLARVSGVELLRLASRLARLEAAEGAADGAHLRGRRIAVLAGFSTQHLVAALRLYLLREGVRPEIYQGEFDSISWDILEPGSGLYAFQPDTVVVLPHHGDLKDMPRLLASEQEVAAWVERTVAHYQHLWTTLQRTHPCQVVHALFAIPPEDPLGVAAANYVFSQTSCLRALNVALTRARPSYVSLLDVDAIAANFGKRAWFDMPNYYLSKQGLAFDAYPGLLLPLARMVSASSGFVRKCLVLDLDNTLWGGVVGDDGVDGIGLDPNDAVGEAFLAFQRYVVRLKERGVILAVCSKNELDNARAPFEGHPHMLLKLDDVSCFVANWNNKADNLREIAARLDIGLTSLVFFDDNPAEREIVRQSLPGVAVVDVPDEPAAYVRALHDAHVFEWSNLSAEDLVRSESYRSREQHEQLLVSAVDYDAYLRSLDMRASCGAIEPAEVVRFAQLINKSNQFNLRTQRYTEAQIEALRASPDHALLQVTLSDRFASYGLISCVILERRGAEAFIDTWVMSCRVLRRGVESLMFNLILEQARRWDAEAVTGERIPTEKNKLVADLLPELGFALVDEDAGTGTRHYGIAVSGAAARAVAIATVQGGASVIRSPT